MALAKPRTFVNKSGIAVWNLVKRLKLDDARELLVVHDDLDLPVGKVRLRARGSHGGNNGIRSIIETTGSDEFRRLRIGIGRPVVNGKPSYEPDVVPDYVLSDPPPDERDLLLIQLASNLEAVISQRLAKTNDGNNRIPVIEVLRSTPVVRKILLEGDPRSLPKAMANGDSGMQLFDQHLAKLWKAEIISGTESLRLASNPEALTMIMRGLSTRDLAASLVG